MQEKPIPGWIKSTAPTGLLLFCLLLANSPLGRIPAFGPFWNPFSGFWRNAEPAANRDGDLKVPGLHETVTVVYDKRGVPHIFALNAHDLYLAQGFVLARDRLWQMEIQTRAAAGTLAEILGPSMLDHDRYQRRLGIPQGAERDLELVKRDVASWEAASAYSDGVNAYIKSLKPSQYPLEYKLLGYAPGHWAPVNTCLLIKNMQWTLSSGGNELPLTNTLSKFGVDFLRKFYPQQTPGIVPIIPAGKSWDYLTEKPPTPKPDSTLPGFLFPGMPIQPNPNDGPSEPAYEKSPDPGNGSNNFVIAGSKTRDGYPILANDPHLNLGLPSLWYEVQLSSPETKTYGVCLPGAPGVMIGFNKDISWGLTNGTDDVFDWYRITFKDNSQTEYLYGKKWLPVRREIQTIKVKGARTVFDTILSTHQGPVVAKSQERVMNRNTPILHALRWVALEPSNELRAMLGIMNSKNYDDFSAAVHHFKCPSQNFAFAAVNGDIAIFHQGQFPRKWNGQGRFVMNGSEVANDWAGWLPESAVPKDLNPARGWLFSANQSPVDSSYPYYLGNRFLNGERARRLEQVLEEADSISAERAFRIMLDDYDLHAEEILPILLKKMENVDLSPADSTSLKLVSAWKYRHAPDQLAPALFDKWWRQLYHAIWHDEFGDDSTHYEWPSRERTRRLIREEPNSEWYNDITTPAKENLDFMIARSWREACILVKGKTWSQYRPVRINHLANIEAFSGMHITTGGCENCIDAQKVSHGPSWRMVVSMQNSPHGIGIYPGGQSGNPGSPHYDEFTGDWAQGRYYELLFMDTPGDAGTVSSLRLSGK